MTTFATFDTRVVMDTKTTTWNIRGVPEQLARRVKAAAADRGMTLTEFIILGAEEKLNGNGNTKTEKAVKEVVTAGVVEPGGEGGGKGVEGGVWGERGDNSRNNSGIIKAASGGAEIAQKGNIVTTNPRKENLLQTKAAVAQADGKCPHGYLNWMVCRNSGGGCE